MAMMDHNNWGGGQDQNMVNGDDDFQFIDVDGMANLGESLAFEFPNFDGTANNHMSHQQPHQTHQMQHQHQLPRQHEQMDTPMNGTHPMSSVPNTSMHSSMPIMTTGASHPAVPSHLMPSQFGGARTLPEIEAQIQELQNQKLQHQLQNQQRRLEEEQRRLREQQAAFYAQQQQQQQQRNMVPPTPQSLEIQAANQFYNSQHHDQAPSSGMFDRYQHLKEQQDMAFTPLVSPAVTPLDANFSNDYNMLPSAYLSPLTSPALMAQNDPMTSCDGLRSGRSTNSPIDMESPSTPANSIIRSKMRKNNVTKRGRANVGKSPHVKPQRKKTLSTPVIDAQILSELAVAEASEPPTNATSTPVASTGESEDASVSPETLSEMPPPPVPATRSARQSPYIQPQANHCAPPPPAVTSLSGKPSPATPASLFKISPRSKNADPNNPGQVASDQIESFELPEPVQMPKPALATLDTESSSPITGEAETAKPGFQPLPSPIATKPNMSSSTQPSPALAPKTSASNPRKTPVVAPKGAKKRPSVSSTHASPALMPKISPNIKPLLPGTPGMSAEDTASQLLASKSNYQRILEGNTVPGVSYPSELSTNLTSKRTSHKIAEQGRRNRINMALQEISTLLPSHVLKEAELDGDKKDGKAGGPNSKASTVELAIGYIKQLQQDVVEANKRADEAEKKLQERLSG